MTTTNTNAPLKVASVYVYYDRDPETKIYTITLGSMCVSNFQDMDLPFILSYINPTVASAFQDIVLTEENLYYNPECYIVKDDDIYTAIQELAEGTHIYMQPMYYIPFNPQKHHLYTFERQFSEEELHTDLLYVILQTFIYGMEPHQRALKQLKNAAATTD